MTTVHFPLDTVRLQSATAIVRALWQQGHEAYFVGGCVRDLVMGCVPKDVDIATSATPEHIEELFPNTVGVGAQFGVVLVILKGVHFEVATFRSDSVYSDGRHPDFVQYAKTPEEDARRRDFTFNALFYNPLKEELLDFQGGQRDIRQKIVRAIGNPVERFREDKLRLLRAVRFAVRFGYDIEVETRRALVATVQEIHQVSAERIRDELTRLLTDGHSYPGFLLLDELGLLREVLPELEPMKGVEQPPEFHPEGDVWVHTMWLLKFMDEAKKGCGVKSPGSEAAPDAPSEPAVGRRESESDRQLPDFSSLPDTARLLPETYPTPVLAWAALLHDIGKPGTFQRSADRIRFNEHMEVGAKMARQIGRRLRMPNEEVDAIAELVLEHLKFKDVHRMRPSTLKRFVRREHFAEHLELHRLDCLASHGRLDAYRFARDFAHALKPEETRPPRLLTGEDLIELGYRPGPQFKSILTALEDAQLENKIADREEALQFLKEKFPRV